MIVNTNVDSILRFSILLSTTSYPPLTYRDEKIILLLAAVVATALGASAQKFALVDMEYVLANIPAYEMANEQLSQISQRWQKEVEAKQAEAETLYKNYQTAMVFLTDEQKKQHEEAIVAKEKEAMDLRNKYFWTGGRAL